MNEQEKKSIFTISDLLADAEVYAGKIDFCIDGIMELSEPHEYEQYTDEEKPIMFWGNRDRIKKYSEMQKDYYHDKVLPLIRKAQEEIEMLLQNEKK